MQSIVQKLQIPKKPYNTKIGKKNFWTLLILFFLALFVVVLFSYSKLNKDSVNCGQIVSETQDLLRKKEYVLTLEKLLSHEKKCGSVPKENIIKNEAKTKETLDVIKYNTNLAKAEYMTGDKNSAKEAANRANEINKHLNPNQRMQLPEGQAIFFALFDILNDQYDPAYEANGMSEENTQQ